MTREVQSPDGRVWRVRRRWLPRRPWLPKDSAIDNSDSGWSWWWWSGPDTGDFDLDFDGIVGWIIGTILLLLVLGLLFDFVIPLIVLVLQIVFFALFVAFGTIGRMLGIQPWRVEGATIGKPRLTREVYVRGLGASRAAVDQLATEIQSGQTLLPTAPRG